MPMESARPSRINWLFSAVILAALVLLLVDQLGLFPVLHAATGILYQWLILLGGVALLLGIVNVAWLHLRRILAGQRDWVLSVVLLAVLMAVFAAGVLSPQGESSPLVAWLFDSLVAPGQLALFALLLFFMAAAAFQYLRFGRTGGAWLLAGALIVLVAQAPINYDWLPPGFVSFTYWFVDTPVMAALRGALIGTGLALVILGIRIFVGKL